MPLVDGMDGGKVRDEASLDSPTESTLNSITSNNDDSPPLKDWRFLTTHLLERRTLIRHLMSMSGAE